MSDEASIFFPRELFEELTAAAERLEKERSAEFAERERVENQKTRFKVSVLAQAVARNVQYVLSPSERKRYFAIGEYLFSAGADVVEQIKKTTSFREKMKSRFVNAMASIKGKFEELKRKVFHNPLASYIKRIMVALMFGMMLIFGMRDAVVGIFDFFASLSWRGVKKVYQWVTEFFSENWGGIKRRMKSAWDAITSFYEELTAPDDVEIDEGKGGMFERLRKNVRQIFRTLRIKLYECFNDTKVGNLPSKEELRARNLGYMAAQSAHETEEGELEVRLGNRGYRGDAVRLLGESALQGMLNNTDTSEVLGRTVVAEHQIPIYHKVLGNDIDWSDEASVKNAMAVVQGKFQKTLADAMGGAAFSPDAVHEAVRAISAKLYNPDFVLSDRIQGVLDAFQVNAGNAGEMESLLRVLNVSLEQWGVEGV